MKKAIITTILTILFAYAGQSQLLTAQDSLVLRIPEPASYATKDISDYVKSHYSSDSARARALFVWTASNIRYDIDRALLDKSLSERVTTREILRTRKAVCQGYSDLLVELYSQCGIKALFVPGYGKHADGSITERSHAWVAAKINDHWYLFDPTWSAGTVKDGRFTRRFSNRFYKVLPGQMIRDHMPFDPLFQFLEYPITSREFYEGKSANHSPDRFFNYADSLEVHNALTFIEQTSNAARRIRKNGVTNNLTREMLQLHEKNLELHGSKVGFDEAAAQYKLAIALFNKYIEHKNKRFSSAKDEKEIQGMIDSVVQYIKITRSMLAPIVANDEKHRKILASINESITRFSQRVDEEKVYLSMYFQSNRSSNKTKQ